MIGCLASRERSAKFVLLAVVAALAGRLVANDVAHVVDVYMRPRFLIAAAPAADADDAVVLGPIGKAVVGGVHGDETAAARDEGFEIFFRAGGPTLAVVVADDDVVVGELRFELADALAGRWRGGDVDLKPATRFECFFQKRRGGFPIVVVLAVDDEGAEFFFWFVFGFGFRFYRRRARSKQWRTSVSSRTE